jgi:hypothetical protein
MPLDFADAKKRFASSRKLHPSVVEELIEAHEEALGLLRELVSPELARTRACPVCGPLEARGKALTHARGCRLARVLGSG